MKLNILTLKKSYVLRYNFFNKNMYLDHFLKDNSKNDMNSDHFLKTNSKNNLKRFYSTQKIQTYDNC